MVSPFAAGFHAAILGAPLRRVDERRPGPTYELVPSQLSDWLVDVGGREEVRRICREWMRADPRLDRVEIVSGRRVLEVVW